MEKTTSCLEKKQAHISTPKTNKVQAPLCNPTMLMLLSDDAAATARDLMRSFSPTSNNSPLSVDESAFDSQTSSGTLILDDLDNIQDDDDETQMSAY